jgi:preprotein translocase subunit Sss1
MSGILYGFLFLIIGAILLTWNIKNPSREELKYMDIEGYGLGILGIVGGIYVIVKEAIILLK